MIVLLYFSAGSHVIQRAHLLGWYLNACWGHIPERKLKFPTGLYLILHQLASAIIIVAPTGSTVTAIPKTCTISFSSFLFAFVFFSFTITFIITSAITNAATVIVTITSAVVITAAPKTTHIDTSFINFISYYMGPEEKMCMLWKAVLTAWSACRLYQAQYWTN